MTSVVTLQHIERFIVQVRGHKVMLDAHLANPYGVETRTLLQAVKRNSNRFPLDFMFQLSDEEARSLRSQFVISKQGRGGHMYQAVNRAKQDLSLNERSELYFRCPPKEVHRTLSRKQFESWIAHDIKKIDSCIKRLLAASNCDKRDVNLVFLTGGTSFVPAVRAVFERRFGTSKLRHGDEFVSVAKGLALYARDYYSGS